MQCMLVVSQGTGERFFSNLRAKQNGNENSTTNTNIQIRFNMDIEHPLLIKTYCKFQYANNKDGKNNTCCTCSAVMRLLFPSKIRAAWGRSRLDGTDVALTVV